MSFQSLSAQSMMVQAVSAFRSGHFVEARRLCRAMLAAAPRQFEALRLLGLVEGRTGRLADALNLFDQALKQQPRSALALNDRGLALFQLGRLDQAVAAFDRAITVSPGMADAHFNRGNAIIFRDRPQASRQNLEDALASFERAVAMQPGWDAALLNHANVLADLGRHDEALIDFATLIARHPRHVGAHIGRADTLQRMAQLDAARAAYDAAIAVAPSLAEARTKRAALLLRLGHWSEGWREMEWRRRDGAPPPYSNDASSCNGASADGGPANGGLAARRLLLRAEQGFGDTIQFARFAARLAAAGHDVTLEVHPRLVRLMRSLDDVRVVARGTVTPSVDAEAPLMSVPAILKFDRSDLLEPRGPYLRAKSEPVDRIMARMPVGFRIGIAWQGNPGNSLDRGRSVPVSAFLPLAAIDGVVLVSLQKHDGTDQLSELPAGHPILTLGDQIDGGPDAFVDTAAAMMHLDLVISSDTAVAHLAGALGRPLWIALQHVADWRWMAERDDTPWYPQARLFRQSRPGDWTSPFARIKAELRRLQASNRAKEDRP